MFDLISIGDSVVDTYVFLEEAEVITDKAQELRLSLPYGKKVPVGDSVSMVAGNAANNAVGASRLDLKTAIYTNVGNFGDDRDDERIIKKLKKEKVDIKYVVETDKLPSNHNIILDYKGERTILTHHQPWKFKLPDLDQTKFAYLTSLSPSFVESDFINQIIHYLERTGAKLIYNPGTFQIKLGIKKYPRLLSLVEVFIVNKEEALKILSFKEEIGIKKLLEGIADLGCKKVVITDGKNGSFGFDGRFYFHLDHFPAKLVEMTGAGDAFATGVLAGLFHNQDLSQAMRWGAANAASVVEQVGAQAGLLSYNQMKLRLKENSRIVAMQI